MLINVWFIFIFKQKTLIVWIKLNIKDRKLPDIFKIK